MVGCSSGHFFCRLLVVSRLKRKLLFTRNTSAAPCTEPDILAWQHMVQGTSAEMGECPLSYQGLKCKQKVALLCFSAQNSLCRLSPHHFGVQP